MSRKTNGFRDFVGRQWNRFLSQDRQPSPKDEHGQPVPLGSLSQRLEQRFEVLMQEVDELEHEQYSLEDQAEYLWIVLVRMLLPIFFFLGFGYEDGLFMTGFRYLSFEPFILLMYVIGYGLEGLRVAMVYSMNFSKSAGRRKAHRHQLIIWLIMSIGCGVAQLASAMVIQALGSDTALTGGNALAQGAKAIMNTIPWLIYLAIGIRVSLCALADWACSGFLHKRKETVEQKVTKITTKANNLSTVMQAQLQAQTLVDLSKQFQEMVQGQQEELKELRGQQKGVFDVVFQAGMRQINRITEVSDQPRLGAGEDE